MNVPDTWKEENLKKTVTAILEVLDGLPIGFAKFALHLAQNELEMCSFVCGTTPEGTVRGLASTDFAFGIFLERLRARDEKLQNAQ